VTNIYAEILFQVLKDIKYLRRKSVLDGRCIPKNRPKIIRGLLTVTKHHPRLFSQYKFYINIHRHWHKHCRERIQTDEEIIRDHR
jgi:hypothetical protein